jgi:hypothetical protein
VLLLSLIAFLGLAAGLARVARLPIAVVPAVAMSLIICALYLASLVGALRAAGLVLHAAGLLLVLGEVVALARNRVLPAYVQSAIVIPLLCSLFLWWRLHDVSLIEWDDFATWALVSKEILARDRVTDASSLMMVKEYPPATNLFHYFVLRLSDFHEGKLLTAHAWLLVWPLAPLFYCLKWKHAGAALLLVIGAFVALHTLGLGFRNAMVDHVLSVFFASAIVSYFILAQEDRSPLWLLPTLAVLPLIKPIGIFLAMTAVLAVSVDYVLRWRERKVRPRWLYALVGLVLLALAPMAAKASWELHLATINAETNWPVQKLTLGNVLHEWSPSGSDSSKRIVANFLNAISERPISRTHEAFIYANDYVRKWGTTLVQPFTLLQWSIVLAALFFTLVALTAFDLTRMRLLGLFGVCAVGLVAYLALLLATYTVLFNPATEGLQLTSFERYVDTFVGALALIALFLLQGTGSPQAASRGWVLVPVVVFLFAFQTPPLALVWGELAKQDEIRTPLLPKLEQVRAKVAPDKRVHTIYQNTPGTEIVRIRFELAPRPFRGPWAVGAPYGNDDEEYTINLTTRQFADTLRGSDYLFLAHVDDNFWEHYESLFEPADRRSSKFLFRIDASEPDRIKLFSVP